jgi:hypothetical protein
MLDFERERQRLAELYAAMSDDELRKIAADSGELSEPALLALSAEARHRGLDITLAESSVLMERVEERQLVVVQQFREVQEALLAKGMLESAGMECFLVDDNMVRMDWFLSNLLGGVKLAVAIEDAEVAREILTQPIPDDFNVEGVGEFQQPRCPKCGSIEITHEPSFDKRIALPALYMAFPLPIRRDTWKCATCGAHWRAGMA